jgi:tetratricopeptide (TPR) repeat protein
VILVHTGSALAAGKAHAKKAAAGATSAPGTADADFIVKSAEAAMKARRYEVAVSLWRGVVALRGDADPAAWKLAEAFTLGGDFASAQDALEIYSAATTDAKEKARAAAEIDALAKRVQGYSSSNKPFAPRPATSEAKVAFKRGRTAFNKKQYAVAVGYYKAGTVMAPELPGPYRELGECFDKLGRPADATTFYSRYLVLRPFSQNAKPILDRLARTNILAKVDIVSTLPCEEVWINGQRLDPRKDPLPIKGHRMAPGRYKLMCYNEAYHIAQFEDLEVKAGEKATLEFQWALLVNKLEPWGRIAIENPNGGGGMYDIGPYPEIGVPVPKDRRALKLRITGGEDPTRIKEELIKLEPGKRFEVTWK